MYEFRQNWSHRRWQRLPKCSLLFVSLTLVEASITAAVLTAAHKPHHAGWSHILLTFKPQPLFVLKLSCLPSGSWQILKVSQRKGLSLHDVWPCYCFYFEGIVCGGIWIILCLSGGEMRNKHVGDVLSTAPPDFLSPQFNNLNATL